MEYSFLAARLSFTFDVHMCVFHLANKLCCCCYTHHRTDGGVNRGVDVSYGTVITPHQGVTLMESTVPYIAMAQLLSCWPYVSVRL